MRFYKKPCPPTRVELANNTSVEFTTLDGVTGYLAVVNPFIDEQFAKMMGQDRNAISEISAEEFTAEYVEKKKGGQQPIPYGRGWREEFGAGVLKHRQNLAPPLPPPGAAAAAVVSQLTGTEIVPQAPVPPTAPVKPEVKPTIGRRNSKKPSSVTE